MAIINEYDALTGENTEIQINAKELAALVGDLPISKSPIEILAEKQALKQSAIAKLAALGLTLQEAESIIS
jgi:hypothetical protein